jgi:HAD superfamily hydrolase (TIGR01490 family)
MLPLKGREGEAMIAALFDVEGTLYTAQMGRGLLIYARAHGYRSASNRYYLRVLPYYALHSVKLASEERARRAAIAGLGGVVKGWTLEEADQAFDWIINDYLLPAARKEVLARLEAHRAQGHAVVLVSGMPQPSLERLGASIGATGAIGTRLEARDGRYTGRSILPVMVGQDKGKATRAFFEQRGDSVDWAASFAYGDSIHDRGLFDLVGHPVAVHPDADLRELAQAQGWEVIG